MITTERVEAQDPRGNKIFILVHGIGFTANYPAVSHVPYIFGHTVSWSCTLCPFRRDTYDFAFRYSAQTSYHPEYSPDLICRKQYLALRQTGIDNTETNCLGMSDRISALLQLSKDLENAIPKTPLNENINV